MTARNPQQTYFSAMEKVPTPVYYWAGIGAILALLAQQLMGRK
jgi:hypothetical protein